MFKKDIYISYLEDFSFSTAAAVVAAADFIILGHYILALVVESFSQQQ